MNESDLPKLSAYPGALHNNMWFRAERKKSVDHKLEVVLPWIKAINDSFLY